MFYICHLKLADTHMQASVIVCLPELSVGDRFILQVIWEEMCKKMLAIHLLLDAFNAHTCTVYIDHRGILQNMERPLNAK